MVGCICSLLLLCKTFWTDHSFLDNGCREHELLLKVMERKVKSAKASNNLQQAGTLLFRCNFLLKLDRPFATSSLIRIDSSLEVSCSEQAFPVSQLVVPWPYQDPESTKRMSNCKLHTFISTLFFSMQDSEIGTVAGQASNGIRRVPRCRPAPAPASRARRAATLLLWPAPDNPWQRNKVPSPT